MNNKKGQFFLITTAIIAVIIFGLVSSVNYALTQPEPTVFYDLSKNFDKETLKVVDYGLLGVVPSDTNNAKNSLSSFIDNFTSYAREKDPNIDLVYIFGNQDNVTVYNLAKNAIYTCTKEGQCGFVGGESQSTVSLDIATSIISKDITQPAEPSEQYATKHITVKIGDINYDFDVLQNNQFYFILKTEKKGEIYTVTKD